jgi:hypothetical protein
MNKKDKRTFVSDISQRESLNIKMRKKVRGYNIY